MISDSMRRQGGTMTGGDKLRQLRQIVYTETRVAWLEWQKWRVNGGDKITEKKLEDEYRLLKSCIIAANLQRDYDAWCARQAQTIGMEMNHKM